MGNALVYAIGYIFRVLLSSNQTSKAIFILEEVLIIVSPAAFLAFNYVVYGRIISEAVGQRKGFTLVRPNWVSTIFVISDIVTFLMQVGLLIHICISAAIDCVWLARLPALGCSQVWTS